MISRAEFRPLGKEKTAWRRTHLIPKQRGSRLHLSNGESISEAGAEFGKRESPNNLGEPNALR